MINCVYLVNIEFFSVHAKDELFNLEFEIYSLYLRNIKKGREIYI